MSRSTTNYGTKPTATTTLISTEAPVSISRGNDVNPQVMGSSPRRFKYLRSFLCKQHPEKDFSAILKKFEEEFPITDVPLKMKRKHGREGTRRKTAAKTEASGEEKENVLPSEASSSKVTLVQSDGIISASVSSSNTAGQSNHTDADGHPSTETGPGSQLHKNRCIALNSTDLYGCGIGNDDSDADGVSTGEVHLLQHGLTPGKVPTVTQVRSRKPRLKKTADELERETVLRGLVDATLSRYITLPCKWSGCKAEITGNAYEFEAHIRQHITKSDRVCSWNGCRDTKVFQTADTLARHCRDSHTDKAWFYQCRDCATNPMRPVLETLTRHRCMERTCTVCRKVLSSTTSHRKHVESCTRDETFTRGESPEPSRKNKRRRIGS